MSSTLADPIAPPAHLSGGWLDHAPLPLARLEGSRHLLRYANAAFCELVGKTSEELIGKSSIRRSISMEHCDVLLDHVYRTGESASRSDLESAASGRSYTAWPMKEEGRTVGVMLQVTQTVLLHEKTREMNEALLLGSLRQHELTAAVASSNALLQSEIRERKVVEQALHQAQTKLQDHAGQLEGMVIERTAELTATNSQLDAFVYSIAHDLRAPLRAMQGFAGLLVDEAGAALSATGRDYAARIDKAAQFMDTMLGDLLAFSRVSQLHVELTAVKLQPVVTSVLARLEKDIQKGGAHMESPGPWPVVRAHEPTLTQVLFNLTSNALKFVAPGVPPLIRLRAEERGEFIRVWVEDNGIGIAPGHQEQIFRPFNRLLGEKYAGTGIGLTIVQKGIERMGGKVGVESASGKGSRFWFELRRAGMIRPSRRIAAPSAHLQPTEIS